MGNYLTSTCLGCLVPGNYSCSACASCSGLCWLVAGHPAGYPGADVGVGSVDWARAAPIYSPPISWLGREKKENKLEPEPDEVLETGARDDARYGSQR